MIGYVILMRKHLGLCLVLATLSLMLAACGTTDFTSLLATVSARVQVDQLAPKVLTVRPHDTTSYTEGLVWRMGELYESAGLYGQSSLRQVDPQTGKVLRQVTLPAEYFGEGLALAGNRLIQLTWHEQVAFVYDVTTFGKVGELPYTGEGWGLCFDGSQYFMTDGSATIYVRDATTFQVTRTMSIVLNGQPIANLNELECVGDSLYSNVWHTDNILRINKQTGRVTAKIDASGLLTAKEIAEAGGEGVLNGIAYDSQHDTFLITGKNWPWLFEVQFVPRKL
jgi:glutaminyl-peptide cyclotransferase